MKHTEETKRKLSEMRKGEKNPFFGKKHTEEFKRRLGERTRINNLTRQYEIIPRRVPELEQWKAAYIAGIVDGEGSICLPKGRRCWSISVANTDENLMRWLVENIGGNYRHNPNAIERVPCYIWALYSARDVAALVRQIRPFMIIKAVRADECRAFLDAKYGDRIDG